MKARKPTVSVLCLTYNQKDYIRQALDSFLMQKTEFDFEVLINDDASTDGTAEILKEYAAKHPGIIKPIFQKENQYSQGKRNFIVRFLLPKTQGKYLALCEGDDYWTDPMKLQRQVDFLEAHPDYSLCFHPVRVFFEHGEQPDSIFPAPSNRNFTVAELLKNNFIQTNSVMYRAQNYKDIATNVTPGDWYLHLYHAQFGKIGFIDKVMADYRRHPAGIWYGNHKDPYSFWEKNGIGLIALFSEMLKIYGGKPEYLETIQSQIVDMFNRLVSVDEGRGKRMIHEALTKFPDCAELYVSAQSRSLAEAAQTIKDRDYVTHKVLTELARAHEENKAILESRSFQLGYYLLHPWKAPRRVAGITVRRLKRVGAAWSEKQAVGTVRQQYEAVARTILDNQNFGNKKMAVVLHLYYVDMWDDFRQRLERLGGPDTFDLIVSVPMGHASTAATIQKEYPTACVVEVPNRGRDVLPFLKIMSALRPKEYEYVLKIHSKKSKHREDGAEWFENIVEHLIPKNPELTAELLETLAKETTAVVGPEGEYISLLVNYESNKAWLRKVLAQLKGDRAAEEVDQHRYDYGFFAGTMFWIRLDAIKDILDADFSETMFEPEGGQIDNTFAHALERLFCVLPEIDKKRICAIGASDIHELEYHTTHIPEWSDIHFKSKKREKS